MSILPAERFTTLEYTDLLELRITQFEPDAANTLVLQCTWKMQPVTGKDVSNHFSHIALPMPPNAPQCPRMPRRPKIALS